MEERIKILEEKCRKQSALIDLYKDTIQEYKEIVFLCECRHPLILAYENPVNCDLCFEDHCENCTLCCDCGKSYCINCLNDERICTECGAQLK